MKYLTQGFQVIPELSVQEKDDEEKYQENSIESEIEAKALSGIVKRVVSNFDVLYLCLWN